MEKEFILKKAVFGGFDCVQVMNCIADLQEKALDAEKEAEELKALQATLSELERVMKEKDDEIESLSASIAEAESKFRVSRASAQIVKDSIDYADRYVENAKIIAQNITEKTSPIGEVFSGAATQIRTGDLILTKDVLYQLSHSSVLSNDIDYITIARDCQ